MFRNMSTIESKHSEKLESMKNDEEKISYLLDVAGVLEEYGESDYMITEVEQRSGKLNDFVEIVGAQNKGALYKKYLSIV